MSQPPPQQTQTQTQTQQSGSTLQVPKAPTGSNKSVTTPVSRQQGHDSMPPIDLRMQWVCFLCDGATRRVRVCPSCKEGMCDHCAHKGGEVGKNPYCILCLRHRYATKIGRGCQGELDASCDDEIHDMYGDCTTIQEMREAEQ
jgi:hypothetical protein